MRNDQNLQVKMSHIVVVQVLNAKQDLLDEEARLERNIKYKKNQEWSKKNLLFSEP